MRVGSLCVGRSGDKGAMLDPTLVALDDQGYALLERELTAQVAAEHLMPSCPVS